MICNLYLSLPLLLEGIAVCSIRFSILHTILSSLSRCMWLQIVEAKHWHLFHTFYRPICNISTTPRINFKIYGIRVTPGNLTFTESFTELLRSCEKWKLNAARNQDQIVWLTFKRTFCEMLYRGALMCLGLMVSGPEELAASNRFIHAVNLCANTVPLASKPCKENFHLNDFLFWRCVPSFNK